MPDDKITALYCRFSANDEKSNSINNQKALLQDFADEHGYANCAFYVDDGATGTNFTREAFENLLNDIERGLVGRVVVKDASRFGRVQSMAGYYIDVVFPMYDVEFVSVLEPDKEFLPLHHFINELYAKDISKKIRAVFRQKGNSGRRLSSLIPYGYIKGIDKDGKENWIIDERAAETVRLIFDLYVNENFGPIMIFKYLNEKKILSPSEHKKNRAAEKNPYKWSHPTVAYILTNQMYCGDTVNFKTEIKSYKDKTIIYKDPKDYKIFPGTHEAIISRDVFEKAQLLYDKRRRRKPIIAENPFNGLCFCKDCGVKMFICRSRSHAERYICNRYILSGCTECSPHGVIEKHLKKVLVQKLQKLIDIRKSNGAEFNKKIKAAVSRKTRDAEKSLKEKISVINGDKNKYDILLSEVFIEKTKGEISREIFSNLSEQYNRNIQRLKSERLKAQLLLNELENTRKDVNKFLKIIDNLDFICDNELTEKFVHSVVDKVIVHERTVKGSLEQPNVDIFFIGVGDIDLSVL